MPRTRSTPLAALATGLALAALLPAAPARAAAPAPAATAAPAGSPALGPLLARTFKLYGGVEAILAVGALRLTGRVLDGVTAPDSAPRFERLLLVPDRYRASTTLGGLESELLILSGGRAFRDGAEVTGLARADLIRLEAARTFLPGELARRRAALVDRGEARRRGRTVHLVELPLNAHASLTAELDPASGAILRAVARASGREVAVTFGGLKAVGAVQLPASEELEVRGRRRTLVIEQAELLRAGDVQIPAP